MKTLKHFLILCCCAGVMFLSSCEEEDPVPPSIAFIGGAGYVSQDDSLLTSTDFMVGITATAGDKKLDNLTITRCCLNNVTTTVINTAISGDNYSFDSTFTTQDVAMDERWEFTVTDKDGETASISFTITTREPVTTTPLTDEKDFEWKRVGAAAGTGLDKFGLSWTANGSVSGTVSAIIKSDANKLVELDEDDWNGVTTIEGLQELIDGKSDIGEYTGVSAEADATYDDFLGTEKDGDYFIINVRNGDVETGMAGTTITITGKYKESE